jgi:DNA-binding SARP family transcriptional activator
VVDLVRSALGFPSTLVWLRMPGPRSSKPWKDEAIIVLMEGDAARRYVDVVRILGPLEVTANNHAISVGGERQRQLLAVLALRANEMVTVDELMDTFFERSGPGSLHTAVSRLRAILGAGWVKTYPRGYALSADAGSLDMIEAQEAAAQSARIEDPAERAQMLCATEALWRGPVLAGIDIPAAFQAEAARLLELRRTVVADRIDAELALGRHAALIGELDVLTRENPFDERLLRARSLALTGPDARQRRSRP